MRAASGLENQEGRLRRTRVSQRIHRKVQFLENMCMQEHACMYKYGGNRHIQKSVSSEIRDPIRVWIGQANKLAS